MSTQVQHVCDKLRTLRDNLRACGYKGSLSYEELFDIVSDIITDLTGSINYCEGHTYWEA